MKQTSLIALAALAAAAAACSSNGSTAGEETDYTAFVNPRIGTGGHGHVFVGANTPFGMVQLGPTSVPMSWDWCSGYHESDSTVIGFSHTHLSGTGIGDLFDVTVMPVVGHDLMYRRGTTTAPDSALWSYADRSKEIVEPGYYSVPLTRYGVLAEMTATPRVGFHRYTFPTSDSSAVVFDLENGGCWDRPTETVITQETDSTISGYRRSKGWAADQHVYFTAAFSQPIKNFSRHGEEDRYARLDFDTRDDQPLLVKVAISPVSVEGAKANMAAELPGWDFDATRQAADQAWEKELSKVRIETTDDAVRENFYTALYHTMISPVTFNDVDGRYRGADGGIHDLENGASTYTVYSLWDTYRAQMPLMSIVNPERNSEMVNSMIDIYEQQGRLPVWHLWANETDCMVGNPGIIPVADAVVKGVEGVDPARAFAAIKSTAMNPGRGNDLRMKYGYIPSDLFNESIAYDMEYAIADGAAARAAEVVGDTAAVRYFTDRSHSWRNYFDKTTGFVRGRDSKGGWRTPFNPFSAEHRADDYCEGNAWQYTWLVPQDLDGLVELYGSREETVARLDSLFAAPSEIVGADASPDISGLIGQYAHGNEPVHHVIYLYTMLGEPDKAADRVREVLSTLYFNQPDGLSGNEDCGQMSAWYILSSLGFYQAEPASGRYWFGSPIVDEASIDVPGGTFRVVARGNSDDNRYIRGVTLNGEPYDKSYITYDDIMRGGTLEFQMGPKE
ncbi:MAG: GH92 family glycosyl hydrolase [Clostridium sp.]|nr:GH92 family glycosyl hydrolase [Clostridium sp.]